MSSIILQGLSIEELQALIENAIDNKISKLSSTIDGQRDFAADKLITRKEASQKLGISLVTLHRYSQEGLIPSYRIGSRVRYKANEVNEALLSMMEIRYSRKA